MKVSVQDVSSFTLTLRCEDRAGIVHQVTGVVLGLGGNVTESAQYSDTDTNTFAMRAVFDTARSEDEVNAALGSLGRDLNGLMKVRLSEHRPRALLMVSKHEHCLHDILYRHRSGELAIDIPLIISNHPDLADLAGDFRIPFAHVPVTPELKPQAEAILMERFHEFEIDFVVLARYMQVLSGEVCQELAGRAINIHHSFLPAFKGAQPYRQAYDRGVKLIGATAHYVTTELDEGPIIVQDVARVTHADKEADLVRIGRDVERLVLSRAVKYHSEDRVIQIGSKTAVFS